MLILINAFFVSAEFAIVSVRRSRISQLIEDGQTQFCAVQKLQQSLDRLLSTTQIGITLSSLALGWISESAVAKIIEPWLAKVPFIATAQGPISHTLALPIAFLLVAYLQIVLGELCPKSLAMLYPEQLARVLGRPSLALSRLFDPFVWVLNQSTRWLLRGFGIRNTAQTWQQRVTAEELQILIAGEHESTDLEEEERELLNNVLEFGEVMTSAVMVPRTSIVALHQDATFQDLVEQVSEVGYSRYPLIGESLDDIRGIINFKDLAGAIARGQVKPETAIAEWRVPAEFVPEHVSLNELLPRIQQNPQQLMIVVDEFGGTAGLVTLKDLVAEIIGDSVELESEEDVHFQMLDHQTFLAQAQMPLEEVNELTDLNLPESRRYHTLGGFLLYQFQKIPKMGEVLYYEGEGVDDRLEFTIVSADGPKLNQVRIRNCRSRSVDPMSTSTRSNPAHMDFES